MKTFISDRVYWCKKLQIKQTNNNKTNNNYMQYSKLCRMYKEYGHITNKKNYSETYMLIAEQIRKTQQQRFLKR